MNDEPVKMPMYLKWSQILLGIAVFFFILYVGQEILIPLVFAGMIAILLNPVVLFLCRKKIPRVIAILISLIVTMLLITALFYFFISQISLFSESFPLFKQKFLAFFNDSERWVARTFNISRWKVDAWVKKTQSQGLDNGTEAIGKTVGTIGGILTTFVIMPVYVFMMIYYKPLLLEFISKLFPKGHHATVVEVLTETKGLIQRYLLGLLIEALLVALLNSVALFILDIPYAILLGVIGALLNVIPYIGGVVAVALPMLLALATRQPVSALYVLIAYLIVQFIDNNFFVPKIVASKVKINALISIIVVLVGNALWGIPGMFLSIPLTAIIKVICDRIEPLEPFGFLLGDNQPDITKQVFVVRRRSRPDSKK
ncbi:MAG: AI-2E family transporter [Bacteroidota bacterium]|nr:AI-2E family transporter [Bacteroidota bacterium]